MAENVYTYVVSTEHVTTYPEDMFVYGTNSPLRTTSSETYNISDEDMFKFFNEQINMIMNQEIVKGVDVELIEKTVLKNKKLKAVFVTRWVTVGVEDKFTVKCVKLS